MILTLAVAAPAQSDAADFLISLESEGVTTEDIEIRIVQDHTRPIASFPKGVIVETAACASSIFELWGAAVRGASAPHVALLDIRCVPDRGWLATVLARLRDKPIAFFGAINCGWTAESPHIVGYLVEYAQFKAPLAVGLKETPGVNIIATRAHVTHTDVLRADGFVKTRLLAHLARMGIKPEPREGAAVIYKKRYSFAEYCVHRFRHGRCYGADRLPEAPLWRRPFLILSTTILPLLRTQRIFVAARQARMSGSFWRWLHRILAAETAWSLGEFVGYIRGDGRCRRLLR